MLASIVHTDSLSVRVISKSKPTRFWGSGTKIFFSSFVSNIVDGSVEKRRRIRWRVLYIVSGRSFYMVAGIRSEDSESCF